MPYGLNTDRLAALLEFAVVTGDVLAPAQKFGPATVEVETGLFLYGLVRRMRPKLVVETGTHWGYSGAWIACALADNADVVEPGRLVTIDCNPYQEHAERLWERLGVAGFVTHYIGESNKWDVPPDVKDIDLLWLDSDHGTEHVIDEWFQFEDRLHADAVVAFHDTTLDEREKVAVRRIHEQVPWARWVSLPNMRGIDLLFFGEGAAE